ncbi:MAG: glycosyltransferase family 2 protein [Candidatus Hadarchaeum sp.]
MPDLDRKRLTIIIPAYNEEQSIGVVLSDIKAVCGDIVHEIIVVDDGSTDQTAHIAAEAGARVLRHHRNIGYGAALRTGIKAAQTDYVLTMDSDGQHRAEDVMRLWVLADTNDMVVGQRTSLIHSPLWRMPGKWLLASLANYLARQHIPDLNSGFRLMRREIALRYLHLCPAGFSFSTTITMVFLNRGYTVQYIPIEIRKRIGKSTVSIATGLETIILILRIATLFDPLRIFLPASLIIGSIGVAWSVPYAFLKRGISVGSMLAIVTGILLFALGLLSDQISQLRLERYE